MKLSKIMHIISVIVGFVGAVSFLGAVFGGADTLYLGIQSWMRLFVLQFWFFLQFGDKLEQSII